MASKDRYYNVAGIVQFDPETREYNGSELTDVVIKNVSKQTLVRVTIWPEFDVESVLGRPVAKGDFVVADGKYTTSKSEDGKRTYHNLSATQVAVIPAVPKAERDVVNDDSDDDDEDDDAPF